MALPQPYYQDDLVTLYLGDCRDILPDIESGSVDLVLTDPPYGIAHDTDYTRFSGGSSDKRNRHIPIHDDAEPFDPALLLQFPKVILFGANAFSDRLPKGTWIVWDKRSPTGAKGVMSDGEVAWFSKGHGVYIYSHTWDGFNRATERGVVLHPTQKPVALMTWIINRWTKPGDLVLDPYMGSGPIARACQMAGRHYIGVEIEERYCEIAAKRLEQSVLPLLAGVTT